MTDIDMTSSDSGDGRIYDGGAIERGAEIEIVVDGCPLRAFQGESLAAVLLAAERPRALRKTSRRGAPRGLYCGIGICFECVMTINGQPSIRACRTEVQAGMRVESQVSSGTWEFEP